MDTDKFTDNKNVKDVLEFITLIKKDKLIPIETRIDILKSIRFRIDLFINTLENYGDKSN